MTLWRSLELMVNLIWILDSEKGSSFGNSGVSGSYILPQNEVDLEPKKLAGRMLWIVLRGQEDRLYLLIKIKRVERIIEGYNSGDYLISSEITESLKLVDSYANASKFCSPSTQSLSLGISEVTPDISAQLSSSVLRSMQTKFLYPDKRLLSKINFQLLPCNSYRLAQNALRAVVTHLTLEQVWANGTGDRLNAFSNYAYALISEKIGKKPPPTLVTALKALDPLTVIFAEEKQKFKKEIQAQKNTKPHVDIEFYEIEPGKIYAREFISIDSKLEDLENALNKTTHAEKIHQAMLKDISIFLIGNGITPYESSSIDLLYMSKQQLNVFEIKSANIYNILAQSSKGAFQLACYLNELEKEYNNVSARLVLHVVENIELQNYAVKALYKLGIETLFYDPNKHWPNRITGLPI